MIKLIVCDLDHTLLNDDKKITQRMKSIASTLINQGIHITIATGRAYEIAKPYADDLAITQPMITNNGALIKDTKTNRILRANYLNHDPIDQVMDYVLNHNLGFTYYTESGFVTNDKERMVFYKDWNAMYEDSPITILKPKTKEDLLQYKPYKLLVVNHNKQGFHSMYNLFKDLKDTHVTKSQEAFLDFLPPNTNKGEAVNHLMNELNLSPDEILVFGDNDNDIEMLKLTKNSVAMPDGSEGSLRAAHLIAEADSNNDGVAKTLEKMQRDGSFETQ